LVYFHGPSHTPEPEPVFWGWQRDEKVGNRNLKWCPLTEIKENLNKREALACSWIGRVNFIKMSISSTDLQIQCSPNGNLTRIGLF
jgi:hypothetical protein